MRQKAGFYAIAFVLVAWTIVMSIQEPLLFDGWFVTQWKTGFADYVRANWMGEHAWVNPRAGQYLMYWMYEPAVHMIVTPLLVVAMYVLLLVQLRGRWPDPARDAWHLLVLVALSVLAQPQLGPVLFYRPFHANYVFGIVVQLLWLVPFRFALERDPGGGTLWKSIAMLVLGVIAGACNEHTGPALVAGAGLACIYLAKRGRLRAWHVVGLVAFVVGFALLVTAPAQATRYCGVGGGSLVERLTGRTVIGTLQIGLGVLVGGVWMWGALAIAWAAARKRPPRVAFAWIALGLLVSLTLLLSPKQGYRLQFAGLVFASLGVAMILESFERLKKPIAIVAAAVFGFAVVRSLVISTRVAADANVRMARLSASQPDTVVKVPILREPPSRWFVGDDLMSDAMRHQVARVYQLTAIDLEGLPMIPYQFAIRYDGQTKKGFVPLNQCEARRLFGDELKAHPDIASAELVVVPRETVLGGKPIASSRWRAGKLIAPRASVENELGTRYITIDRGGLEGPIEVTLLGPGKTLKLAPDGDRFPYKPWGPGTYWAVVCAGEDCYLADTIRHKDV